MDVAFVVEAYNNKEAVFSNPWFFYRSKLKEAGINIIYFEHLTEAWREFDAMILQVWLHWRNRQKFDPERILPVMERYSCYRSMFPKTIQVVLNHTDMARRPYATPYWRRGDPILYRTPAYDRSELWPFPADDIESYEKVWGEPRFRSERTKYNAGFIGTPSGPPGYRDSVARETNKVGIGMCSSQRVEKSKYCEIMGSCRIIVCPRGWGEQSMRHWDAWKSGKPVLTDRDCDSVEMIPGMRLQHKAHYLVYDKPIDIPDIVSDWTKPSRSDDLEAIGRNGFLAAKAYDPCKRMIDFLSSLNA